MALFLPTGGYKFCLIKAKFESEKNQITTSPTANSMVHLLSLCFWSSFFIPAPAASSLQKLDLCLAFLDTPKPQNVMFGKEITRFNPWFLEWQVLPGRNVTHELFLSFSGSRPLENPCTVPWQGMEEEGHSSWDRDPEVSVQLKALEL